MPKVTASTSEAMRRPVLVVDVHDRDTGLVEQAPLRREVGVHRLVEVEVVLGEVGEHLAREADASGAAELERVRRDLHGHCRVAGVEHAPEGRLEVDRLGRRPLHLLLRAADDPLDRSEQPGLPPRPLQQVAYEEGGRRLAVRAGDAHHVELGGGIAVEARRRGTHRGPHVVHHELGHPELQPALVTSAAAPRSTASGAKSWPSRVNPGTQKKSAPGVTLSLAYASAEISTSGASRPIRSRRFMNSGRLLAASGGPSPLRRSDFRPGGR